MMSDRPMAAKGFDSYRYAGPYGAIMIGANSTGEALSEARRSLDHCAVLDVGLLQKWDGETWVAA